MHWTQIRILEQRRLEQKSVCPHCNGKFALYQASKRKMGAHLLICKGCGQKCVLHKTKILFISQFDDTVYATKCKTCGRIWKIYQTGCNCPW